MEIPKQNKKHCTVVVAERNTGIVMNPETLERWNKLSGGKDRVQVNSLEQARQVAATVVSVRPDLEVMILDFQGKFVERINCPIDDDTAPPTGP